MDWLLLPLFTPLGSFRREPKIIQDSANNKNNTREEEAIAAAGFGAHKSNLYINICKECTVKAVEGDMAVEGDIDEAI